MNNSSVFLPKDFVETREGLLFAVVAAGLEEGKVRCFLRYVQENGTWKKYPTEAANLYLQNHHPGYLFASPLLAATVHGVDAAQICRHHQPRPRFRQLLDQPAQDPVIEDFQHLARLLVQAGVDINQCGVTGSLLPGVHHLASDLDWVCYDRDVFQQCRMLVRQLTDQGELTALAESDWETAFQRRGSELDLAEYLWHERRKYNKGLINGRKFDLSLLAEPDYDSGPCQKLARIRSQCHITDDRYAFDYPARYGTNHPDYPEILCFTATYQGQAQNGEQVAVCGLAEQTATGQRRIVVGSSREAWGEYLKVIRPIY